jgi:Cohesin domain
VLKSKSIICVILVILGFSTLIMSCGSSSNNSVTNSNSSTTTSAKANSNENLSISVSSPNVSQGDTFTVNVMVNTAEESAGAQCALSFDASAMQCTGVTEGTFYSNWATSNNLTTLMFPTTPAIDNVKGTVETTGISVMGMQAGTLSGPQGQGVLLTYQMTANSGVNKTATFNLSDILILDQNANAITGASASTGMVTIGTP